MNAGKSSAIHPFLSPLRYPGGKGKLANFVKLVLIKNGLTDVHYVEPYAGGASVALALLFEEYAATIHINDINKAVYAFWISVLQDTDVLCKMIADTPVTMEEWHKQKNVLIDNSASSIERGFATFFLNRTNRSGIIDGGVIGGKDQTGRWKLDARYNKDDLIARVKKIARYSSRIQVTNDDALETIAAVNDSSPPNTFLYFDPPYYVKGGGLYEHSYSDRDHVRIAIAVSALPRPWIVSYDFHERLSELYVGFQTLRYELSYSAQDRYKGTEIIFFSNKLAVPNVSSAAKIPLDVVLASEAIESGV